MEEILINLPRPKMTKDMTPEQRQFIANCKVPRGRKPSGVKLTLQEKIENNRECKNAYHEKNKVIQNEKQRLKKAFFKRLEEQGKTDAEIKAEWEVQIYEVWKAYPATRGKRAKII